MARDYKPRAKSKKKKKKAQSVPGWLWLAGGLIGGLVIGFGGYALISGQAPLIHTTTVEKPPPARTPAAAIEDKAPEPPRFDFYTLLPKMEVVIPDSDIEAADQALPKKHRASAYILQTGSFRQFSDADEQKASLALLGIEANIETVVINAGETWHRVRIGPYTDTASVKAIRHQLRRNHIEYMLLQLEH